LAGEGGHELFTSIRGSIPLQFLSGAAPIGAAAVREYPMALPATKVNAKPARSAAPSPAPGPRPLFFRGAVVPP